MMRLFSIVTAVCVMQSSIIPSAYAQSASQIQIAPPGFREVTSGSGVTLWRKSREYVQVISPHRGASVKLLHGKIIPSEGAGTNFARMDLRDWWTEWSADEPSAFTLANGQFFNMNNPDRSPLAFSVKINGIVYAGYGDDNEYTGKKMALRIGTRHATVQQYDDDAGSLYAFAEPDIIVGLKPDVSKSGNSRLGRTFMGTMPNGNLLVFSSPGATQRYATRILIAFGADRNKVMMLDGGGSTQLIHEGAPLIPTGISISKPLRTVPLAIGVVMAQ